MGLLLLKPECKDYLWGGHKLVEKYNIEFDGEICAEAWSLSCHKDGPSRIMNGACAGQTLTEFIEKNGKGVLGKNCEKYEDFPILIKLIDAKKALSIQVHPDNEYALKNENQYGKTEMWYVLEAEEGAFLYEGFDKEISQEEFRNRIENNTLTEVLHKKFVKPGDIMFIAPGTLHAIGAGIVLAEIQQNSNVTYRIYDYGRIGADGKPRQLHIEKSLDVTRIKKPEEYKSPDGHMVSCEYFCVDKFDINIATGYSETIDDSSFVSFLVVDGNGSIMTGEEELELKKGSSVFITAGTGKIEVKGNISLIRSSVPAV